MRYYSSFILTFLLFLLGLASCSKDEQFSTNPYSVLTFSADVIQFDTVFTTIGSSTRRFMIYNESGDNLLISHVGFSSGGTKGFRLNLDGQFGTSFDNIELLRGDSIFCFVEVTVNPADRDNPILVDDGIVFTLQSGVRQTVSLQAYGQDAVILRDYTVAADLTLTANRPYIIYNTLTIDSLATLTIAPGASLHFHAGASIDCFGTIVADGQPTAPITFRGDRLDRMFDYLPYDRLDNQWTGIRLEPQSHDNLFRWCDIHSGTFGIWATDATADRLKLSLLESTIHNVGGYGLWLTDCRTLVANTQISNCRSDCVNITGGSSQFVFCTIAQYCPWVAERGQALRFSNYHRNVNNGQTEIHALSALDLTNCLITGYATDEVTGDPLPATPDQEAVFNFSFTNCYLKTANWTGYESSFTDCTYQESSLEGNAIFRTLDTDNFIYDFRLCEGSPARGRATTADDILTTFPTDRLGNQRPADGVDPGCYQFF